MRHLTESLFLSYYLQWRKLWKRRWVALHGAEIVYMDKEPTVENSSTMTITKAQITTATVIDRDDLDGNPNGFAIHINDGHTPTWYLRADTPREKKSWLMRLFHVHAIVKWVSTSILSPENLFTDHCYLSLFNTSFVSVNLFHFLCLSFINLLPPPPLSPMKYLPLYNNHLILPFPSHPSLLSHHFQSL